jgi:hypothetical protein
LKTTSRIQLIVIIVAIAALLVLGGCTGSGSSGASGTKTSPSQTSSSSHGAQPSGMSGQKPAPKETNPTGDIPDTQTFVIYKSAQGHYKLQVPEGWARTVKGPDVSFVSKLDGLSVSIKSSSGPPSVAGVRNSVVPQIKKSEGAVRVSRISSVSVPAGRTVLIEYNSNSTPNSVTGKRVRLENNTYVYFKKGKEAILRLYAPLGADNVDQWHRISQSFGWI